MKKVTKEAALEYHSNGRPGKIEVIPTKPHHTQLDLSLAYSPGVAYPCTEIQQNPDDVYRYTDKGNLVAVISNGTAVLGLGDIGAMSGKPVMEGKGLLFKIYGGIDVFDIEINEKDPEKFCETVERIAPTFGGINLEDIKAPECFYIEERLKRTLDIPVMHDDQHGTAIISAAGLKNALDVAGKDIAHVRIVVNGAGAAAISCTKLYIALGARKENILMLDSKGVITAQRTDLNEQKRAFATTRDDLHTLEEAVAGADVFVGLSKGNVLSPEMVRSMAARPIIFALANPIPEISYEEATAARPDVIMSTGRSDYPNQINNVIGFPYIFRGALDVHATAINEEMKLAAVHAIADLARQPVPDAVREVYSDADFTFGAKYFIPKPVDPRLITEVSTAIARAAIDSGVARTIITDWDAYKHRLRGLLKQETHLTARLRTEARQHLQRVVFADGTCPTMLKAAAQAQAEGVCTPVIMGKSEDIDRMAAELQLNLSGIEKTDMPVDEKTFMQWVAEGKADAFIASPRTLRPQAIRMAKDVIGLLPNFDTLATMHILNMPKAPLFVANTSVNCHPDAKTLAETAHLSAETVHFLGIEPVVAIVNPSCSDTDADDSATAIRAAVVELQQSYPQLAIDGGMQVNEALNSELLNRKFPASRLQGKRVNTLVFPSISTAAGSCQLLQSLHNEVELIGPIQMGLNKAIYFADAESSVEDLVHLAAIVAIDAYRRKMSLGQK